MQNNETIIVIGGGLAGVYATENLRKEGFEGRIILFDQEAEVPYDRPPLSKEFMLGDSSETDILLYDPSHYDELNIELELGVEISSIDRENKIVITNDGRKFNWDKLLLATGASLRKLPIKGSELNNIFYLKTLSDAKQIKEKLTDAKKVVVIGSGFIGAELASSCRHKGIDVTLFERAHLPMARLFGDEIGKYFLTLHEDKEIDFISNDSVIEFVGEDHVQQVVSEKGRIIDCDAVIVGIGVEPNTELGEDFLEINKGYVVNEYGETSVQDIYAAGDCTTWPYKGEYIHVEHWDHAMNHGMTVAKNMVNKEGKTQYDRVPYFWSDQYNHRIQYVGYATEWTKTIMRGDFNENKFTYFYLDENNVVQAALIMNEPRNVMQLRRLIGNQKEVNIEELAEPSVPLRKL